MKSGARFLLLVITMLAVPAAWAVIATTKHNLSTSGPGAIKAASEDQICIFCHTPHNATPSTPLWNRRNPGATYTPYTSSSLVGAPGQPTGSSILCLSCHDGTIALGDVLSRSVPIGMAGGITTMPLGKTRLGTDLSDDHPISFAYSATLASQRGELVMPSTLTGKVKLDATGQMQCSACHDAHDDTNGKFLVMSNIGGALCQTCHVKNFWSQTLHRTSTATWNGIGTNPWPTTSWTNVANNACESCHQPHTAGGSKRLMHYAAEETNCFVCHNGNVAPKNIQSEFNKASFHPVANTTGVHDPKEPGVVTSRHVECVDCHNPHAANNVTGNPNGPLTGVRGISIAGAEINPAAYEYQICFRCHGDSPGKPAARTTRQIVQTNVRLEFDVTNPSYHPVVGPGKNTNVPSLIAPLTTSSTIGCSDCHNSNTSPTAGGTGPNGPHGSTYAPILLRQYITADNTSESASNYALCYGCHSRTSILGNQGFARHQLHIQNTRAPCNVCHDPHGISGTQGTTTNNSHLINFDTSVVSPSSNNILRYESTGVGHGRCYLNCHGHNHSPESY